MSFVGMQKNSFLSYFRQEDTQGLLDRATYKTFQKGQYIVETNNQDRYFYIIDKGSVRVTLISGEGKEVCFADMGEGCNFGELSAIDGLPRSANVFALEQTCLFIFSPQLFDEVLKNYPAVRMVLMRQLSAIVRRLCDRIFEYSTLNVANRIHIELLRMATDNIDLDGVSRINNPPSQSVLASRISCTREAISREFQFLQNKGIVNKKSKQWIIGNIDALAELVRQDVVL